VRLIWRMRRKDVAAKDWQRNQLAGAVAQTGGYTTGRADVVEMLRQKARPYL
jgi:7-keto-8-aminopelargonate synthetase-like enzyme